MCNVVRNNFDGYLVDYEPSLANTTEAHAIAYAAFLTQFSKSLHSKGKKLGMDVSGWGILDKYSLYGNINLDMLTSMATYSGSNVTNNMDTVSKMLTGIDNNLIGIGIGSMCSNQGFVYNWTQTDLNTFLSFLKEKRIYNIDIWRADIDNPDETNTTLTWFLETVENWNTQTAKI